MPDHSAHRHPAMNSLALAAGCAVPLAATSPATPTAALGGASFAGP